MGINACVALFLGFFLWFINFWSAGDAKLFFLVSVLLPEYLYPNTAAFELIYIAYNSFIPFLLLSMALVIREKVSQINYGGIAQKITVERIIHRAIYAFTVTWIGEYLVRFLGLEENILSILIMAGGVTYIYSSISKYIPEKIGKNQSTKIS